MATNGSAAVPIVLPTRCAASGSSSFSNYCAGRRLIQRGYAAAKGALACHTQNALAAGAGTAQVLINRLRGVRLIPPYVETKFARRLDLRSACEATHSAAPRPELRAKDHVPGPESWDFNTLCGNERDANLAPGLEREEIHSMTAA